MEIKNMKGILNQINMKEKELNILKKEIKYMKVNLNQVNMMVKE